MKDKNRNGISLLFAVVILLWATLISAAPPNPTNSDASGNTAGGTGVLKSGIGGVDNTGFGYFAIVNNVGTANNALGSFALNGNTGSRNNAVGEYSLSKNMGDENSAFGQAALLNNFNGYENTAIGSFALLNNANGNQNLGIGFRAGSNLVSGSNNIYVANAGGANESATTRIGSIKQTRTFISGIRGKKTGMANAVPVVIDSNGQLGTINSSVRFKKDIQDMNDASRKLLELRPVIYRYKQADENGANPLEYGLIAEEVAKVYPDLVAYGADGKIETVQYQKLTPMLLNEFQKQAVIIKQLENEVTALKTQAKASEDLQRQVSVLKSQVADLNALSARLAKIESQHLVGWAK